MSLLKSLEIAWPWISTLMNVKNTHTEQEDTSYQLLSTEKSQKVRMDHKLRTEAFIWQGH